MPTMNLRALCFYGLCVTSLAACESSSGQLDESTAAVTAPVVKTTPDNLKEDVKAQPPVEEPVVVVGLPKLEGAHFAVFNLLHNRPLAHRVVKNTLTIDASQDDFLRYINGNYPNDWQLGTTIDEVKAAAAKGSKVDLWFPALVDTGAQTLTMKIHSGAASNSLSMDLNGTDLPSQKLEKGWQTLSVELPEGSLRAENVLHMKFSNMGRYNKKLGGGALASVSVGPSAPDDAVVQSMTGYAMAQNEVTLAPEQGLAWHVWAQPEGKLSMTLAGVPACGVKAELFGNDAEGKLVSKMSQDIALIEGQGDEQETFLDLSGVAGDTGDVARVILTALPGCDEKGVTIKRAEVVVPGTKPVRDADVPAPKYVLFWMVDTLRADHLPFYNSETNVETPEFSKLAKEGAIFKVAYVQGNESKVSHASLFTGMYPSKHRMLAKGKLRPEHEIIPEAMQDAGYRTGAHISNGYIAKWKGFDQGWNYFINNLRDGWRIDGASMAKHGSDWASKNKEKPFFLYIGTIDPHVTYRRHDEHIGKYDTEPYSGRYKKYCSGEDLGKIKGGGLKPNDRDKLRIKNLYKNEISFNDQAFGAIRASFEEMGIWDETMVVITADHGDEFWEHGGVGHGHSVHQELVHVPLVMYYKPLIKSGTVVDAGVDVLDVYPTLVDVAKQERPDKLQGKSLLPLLLGQHGGYPQPAIATRYLGHYAMQMQEYKLYLKKGDYAVYDRDSDPLEMENAKGKNPLASRWLLDSMSWFRDSRKQWDKQSWGVANNLSPEFLVLRAESGKK